ncbi:MAG: ferredoxin [Patescibacteria group bacterium]
MEVKIDRAKCIGCGTCQAIEPELFKLDDDMKSVFIGDLSLVDLERLKAAAAVCPVQAIEVYDDAGKKMYP